jgi:leucyl/phenylalanyl-tRNA--protein transferase
MPVFRLSQDLVFPPPELSRSDGLLCVGGDLSVERLILAYKNGIFPWFSEQDPVLWWSPDPRLVIFPDHIHISKSLKKKIKTTRFVIRVNTAFEKTITACAQPRDAKKSGTWLIDEMIGAYLDLHRAGIAHSIETWEDDILVGGLYGLSIGASFFGESMFTQKNDASKMALVALANHLKQHDFDLIDCQITTDHLMAMGAVEIPRKQFLSIIAASVNQRSDTNLWTPGMQLEILEKQG